MKIPSLLKSLFIALAVISLTALTGRADVAIGQAAPDFALTDITGKMHKLSDYRGKTVVLEWVNPDCPFVQKHYSSGNIPQLQKTVAADGVIWLAINSGRAGAQGDYEPAAAAAWLKEKSASPAAYFRDQNGAVGRLYKAKTTPQIYVITAAGTLVYDGAIDSIRSAEVSDIAKATNYATAALQAVKNNQPVKTPRSQPYGCSVKY